MEDDDDEVEGGRRLSDWSMKSPYNNVASLLKLHSCFISPAKFLCLAYDSFGQSEVQVKKFEKYHKDIFTFRLFTLLVAGSNCVNPILTLGSAFI